MAKEDGGLVVARVSGEKKPIEELFSRRDLALLLASLSNSSLSPNSLSTGLYNALSLWMGPSSSSPNLEFGLVTWFGQ